MTKKITAKQKPAPSPIVVLEEWRGWCGMGARVVYDATIDKIVQEWLPHPSTDWRRGGDKRCLAYDIERMPV